MQKITPCLWFDGNAEEAAKFYTSVFKKSKIRTITRRPKGTPGPAGSVLTVAFALNGQEFVALNGGPEFKFTDAISFVVNCETQKEIDYFWQKLSAGGKEIQCGWLRDKYGLAWQIVPTVLWKMLKHKDPKKSERVIAAVMNMVKLDIAGLRKAYAGRCLEHLTK